MRAIGGISSGGICAFTVAWQRPDQFQKVLSHVGSFTNIKGWIRVSISDSQIAKARHSGVFAGWEQRPRHPHGNWWLGNLHNGRGPEIPQLRLPICGRHGRTQWQTRRLNSARITALALGRRDKQIKDRIRPNCVFLPDDAPVLSAGPVRRSDGFAGSGSVPHRRRFAPRPPNAAFGRWRRDCRNGRTRKPLFGRYYVGRRQTVCFSGYGYAYGAPAKFFGPYLRGPDQKYGPDRVVCGESGGRWASNESVSFSDNIPNGGC